MFTALTRKPDAILEPMSVDDLASLAARNSRLVDREQLTGRVRPLAEKVVLRRERLAVASASDDWTATASVAVPTAARLRLRIDIQSLPADATLWVYGADGKAIGFDSTLAHDGVLWTPSVEGDRIWLTIDAPSTSSPSIAISAVGDIRSPGEIGANGAVCLRDLACESDASLKNLATGIALYGVVKGSDIAACSGGLVLDVNKTFAPYFLTATHCVSTAAEAATVEAFWDYRAASCNAAPPALSTLPRSSGSALLVANTATDTTLLRLTSVPGNRYWLGWNTSLPAHGTILKRVSHADGEKQVYSTTSIDAYTSTCSSAARPQFHYSTIVSGDTMSGSSGAPAFIGEGQIVGQLRGACGPHPEQVCDSSNKSVDGSLREAFPALEQYLNPGTPTCSACSPSSETACLLGGRFKVTMSWTNRFQSPTLSGAGKIVSYAENKMASDPKYGPMSEIVYFSMYSWSPTAVEAIVRIINGVGINDKYWVYVTGFSNNEYSVTVTDTKSCRTWTRTNAHGSFGMITDQAAFPLN